LVKVGEQDVVMPGIIHNHEIVIVGGGLTGLMAAISAADNKNDVAVISKVHPLRSHSVAAQGGINAALGNNLSKGDDSWEKHALDTVKGSDYLADQDAVEILCQRALGAVIELEHMGTVFSRNEQGRIAQRPFGGAGFPRTCYAGDRTGHNLLHTLYEQCMSRRITFYDEFFVSKLVHAGGRCIGCVALNIRNGEIEGFSSGSILLATGGYGRIYSHSTNAHINTGDGAVLALQAGLPLKDMEFVQFHPTTLYGTNMLITEGARGEGGILMNASGERFMARYAEHAMELAPRDIVARAIQTEIDEGRGREDSYVELDLTRLGEEKIRTRLPGIRNISMDFAGIDPVTTPIPVQPGQHYSMGGVDAGIDGSTSLAGLYAAGECACISVHGANRLGGNSLLESVVFGNIAGNEMTKGASRLQGRDRSEIRMEVMRQSKRFDSAIRNDGDQRQSDLREELKAVMWDSFGIFRRREQMEKGMARIREIQTRIGSVSIGDKGMPFNQALLGIIELKGMALIAESVGLCALSRLESRGSHFRTDFPKRDDTRFLKHSVVSIGRGRLFVSHSPVRLGTFEVKGREY
jgi:succinate dehydrogenase / fumarate reductase, flavoprotein subunit